MKSAFIFVLFYSSLSFAQDLAAPPPMAADEKEIRWHDGLGVKLFYQGLNSELMVEDDSDRELLVKPQPPGFKGGGISYKGLGFSLQYADTDDETARSDARGFKWTVPWDNFMFEFYTAEFNGATVTQPSATGAFRSDINNEIHGFHLTWTAYDAFDFSTVYGLEESLASGKRPGETATYWTFFAQEVLWRGDSSFLAAPSVDDLMGFHYLRRNVYGIGYGGAYVKYFDEWRFSATGSVGPYFGDRTLRYEMRKSRKESDIGLNFGVVLSFASDWGLRNVSRQWGTHLNYGLHISTYNNNSFNGLKLGVTQSAVEFYIGALW